MPALTKKCLSSNWFLYFFRGNGTRASASPPGHLAQCGLTEERGPENQNKKPQVQSSTSLSANPPPLILILTFRTQGTLRPQVGSRWDPGFCDPKGEGTRGKEVVWSNPTLRLPVGQHFHWICLAGPVSRHVSKVRHASITKRCIYVGFTFWFFVDQQFWRSLFDFV